MSEQVDEAAGLACVVLGVSLHYADTFFSTLGISLALMAMRAIIAMSRNNRN